MPFQNFRGDLRHKKLCDSDSGCQRWQDALLVVLSMDNICTIYVYHMLNLMILECSSMYLINFMKKKTLGPS